MFGHNSSPHVVFDVNDLSNWLVAGYLLLAMLTISVSKKYLIFLKKGKVFLENEGLKSRMAAIFLVIELQN